MCCIWPSCVCVSGLQLSTLACEYVHLAPLYLHTAISRFIYRARAAAGVCEAHELVYMQTYIPVMGSGTMAGFESDQNILECGYNAVIESEVMC